MNRKYRRKENCAKGFSKTPCANIITMVQTTEIFLHGNSQPTFSTAKKLRCHFFRKTHYNVCPRQICIAALSIFKVSRHIRKQNHTFYVP